MLLRTHYPPLEPYAAGHLEVGHGHRLYFEESGNPTGKPVVFLHGGPGGGTEAKQRRFFDPRAYRIVLFDQRGCGRSTPFASIEHNTTWDLVADIEALRRHLRIERWQVFGGSWGSSLALAYAQRHPDRVSAMVLRGVFLLRKREIDWFYQDGANHLFPEAWEHFLEPIAPAERGDLVSAYHRRLTGDDPVERTRAAKAWSIWEGRTSYLLPNEGYVGRMAEEAFALAFARIECHYFKHGGWVDAERGLLEHADRLRGIPGVIVQGRYDVVCPAESAWALHRAWPEAGLEMVEDAGHAAHEPGILHRLIQATDALR
jgi:proline iminopeptidase